MFGKAVWRRLAFAAALIASASVANAQTQPTVQSGSQKYRERNQTGAKGKAGGATLAARLLYAKNGTTDLEATTGEFGSPTPPPGTIWKMQVAAVDALGAVMTNYVYNNLDAGGYFKQTYANLFPGQPFQIQAHVRTSAKRNDTVAVTASVQKRPDLAVSNIVAPPRAPINMPVRITGVVSELNGDIGGRTDCVLYVNDVENDRANAIWVDGGDSVSCALTATFTNLGNNRVTIAAVAVDPGDWDMANNAAQQDVYVSTVTPDFDVAWATAFVYDTNTSTTQKYARYINSTFTLGQDWLDINKSDTDGDLWTYNGLALAVPWAPTNLTASVSDGVKSWTVDRALGGCEDFAIGQVNGRTFYTSVTGCGDGTLYVQAGGYSGTVTYTSQRLTHDFRVSRGTVVFTAPAQYVFNTVTTQDVNGVNIFNGGNWTIDVRVTAGAFTFQKPLSFTLDQNLSDVSNPAAVCTSAPGIVFYCEQTTYSKTGRSGSTAFIRQ